MRAIVVIPGIPNSIRLRDIPEPTIDSVPGGKGVLVQVLQVGVDGTDREIIAGTYGQAPPGDEYLVLGHEAFGRVIAIGPNVKTLSPGDYVTALVRRPGTSIYDQIGDQDLTTDDIYFERGISRLHGFLTERYVDAEEFLMRVPDGLKSVAALAEPITIAEKGLRHAELAQRRLKIWQPKHALVMGAGTIGLVATLLLRLKGIKTVTTDIDQPPTLKSDLIQEIGGTYVNIKQHELSTIASTHGPFDIVLEAVGSAAVMAEGMEVIAKNGVLLLVGLPAGPDATVSVEALKNIVLGNKLILGTVNQNRVDIETGLRSMAYSQLCYPGWLNRLLTHRVEGLEQYQEVTRLLTKEKSAIKIYVEVSRAA